jgi:hypothetical protein
MTKNTLFFTASFAALFAFGCNGDDEGKESGGTGVAPTGDDDDDDVEPLNLFDDTTQGEGVDCSGTTVTFSFDFLGEAAEGMIDAADSANDNNWNDYHTLDASGITADGGYTLLSKTIDVGVGINDWADGVGTIFTCEAHYNDPAVMSYITRAYDLDAMLADCVAWGEDPAGMIAGDYFGNNTPIAEGELAGCRTISAAK